MLDSEMEGNALTHFRENEYYGRILGNWVPNENHHLALGAEYSYEEFGEKSPGFPNEPPRLPGPFNPLSEWNSDTISIFGEHQWTINDQFTTFLGVRSDHNDYTTDLWSKRAAIVYTPTLKDSVKLIFNHSVRRKEEVVSHNDELAGKDPSDVEKLNNYEIRYDRHHSDQLMTSLAAFYVDYDVIAWNGTQAAIRPLGTISFYGIELESVYQTEKYKLGLAHSYIQEYDFDSENPGQVNNITASHLGYGDNLANWYNHQTTIYGHYRFNEKWTATSSLNVLWALPGGEDLARYNVENGNRASLPRQSDGFDRSWEESIFLNIGLTYRPTARTTFRFKAHNLMGLIDEDYNKINEFQRTNHYQNQAAAASISMRYTF